MKKLIIITSLLASVTSPALASNADRFMEQDPIGWMMAIISMAVVFCALVILFLCFKYAYPGFAGIGLWFMKKMHRKKQYEQITDRRANAQANMRVTEKATGTTVDDQELATAIGVALFLHEDGMHDQESGVLTLESSTSSWTGAGNNQKRSPMRKF